MTQLFGLLLLWFGPLLLQFSSQLREDLTKTRKLCGRYLVKEIEKLCGTTNWSQFKLEEETPNTEEPPIPGEIEIFDPYEYQNHRDLFSQWGRVTNPASASRGKPINSLRIQSHSKYHYKKVNWLPIKISDYSSSDDVDPYSHDSIKPQKKSSTKIKTPHSLFWGNHPQRKRRGFSNKCCIKGCSKAELAIACLPYIDYLNNDKRTITFD
ncbi:insulin-like peptide INSL6 [Urocitellus parryii]|uniref:Insulin-like domain-containing protein n=1 Tax=Urocitellus parryii TaxID=9999 RepID=A0A8D2H892_UROPR|nr:insulin-like peptide INSL6 [Urocitellus parryii]